MTSLLFFYSTYNQADRTFEHSPLARRFFCVEANPMQDFAKPLYKSKAWQHCRASYLKQVGGLCERCLAEGLITPAVIVHHKVYLTPENINDPSVALNFQNLEALCRRHHTEEHTGKRFVVDEFGRILY